MKGEIQQPGLWILYEYEFIDEDFLAWQMVIKKDTERLVSKNLIKHYRKLAGICLQTQFFDTLHNPSHDLFFNLIAGVVDKKIRHYYLAPLELLKKLENNQITVERFFKLLNQHREHKSFLLDVCAIAPLLHTEQSSYRLFYSYELREQDILGFFTPGGELFYWKAVFALPPYESQVWHLTAYPLMQEPMGSWSHDEQIEYFLKRLRVLIKDKTLYQKRGEKLPARGETYQQKQHYFFHSDNEVRLYVKTSLFSASHLSQKACATANAFASLYQTGELHTIRIATIYLIHYLEVCEQMGVNKSLFIPYNYSEVRENMLDECMKFLRTQELYRYMSKIIDTKKPHTEDAARKQKV